MKRYIIILSKTLLFIVCCVAILGFINYEVSSINHKEYLRQANVANEAHQQIALNLNMIQIAVQTENTNQYEENLSKLYENAATIESLFFIRDEQKDYLASLHSYIEILENRKNLLLEITKLKQNISDIEKVFKENYGGKDAISREKLTNLSSEIEKLKINSENYSEKAILNVVSSVNELLNDIITESNTITGCIDKCYKNRINEINDELAKKFEIFTSKTEELNKSFENQFELETLNKLKQL